MATMILDSSEHLLLKLLRTRRDAGDSAEDAAKRLADGASAEGQALKALFPEKPRPVDPIRVKHSDKKPKRARFNG